MIRTVMLDSFSGSIVDLKPKNRTLKDALIVLSKDPQVSTFDMSSHAWVRKLIFALIFHGYITPVKSAYPWHQYRITKQGKLFMRS